MNRNRKFQERIPIIKLDNLNTVKFSAKSFFFSTPKKSFFLTVWMVSPKNVVFLHFAQPVGSFLKAVLQSYQMDEQLTFIYCILIDC